eukprot:gene5392-6065_t
MSNRHCIDKILERQQKPSQSSRPPSEETGPIVEKIVRMHEQRPYSQRNVFVHLPQDGPRSMARGELAPYCSYHPVCFSRVKRCCCPECLHQPIQSPPWVRKSPPPRFLTPAKYRDHCFTSYPYSLTNDREYGVHGNNSLATRSKNHSSGVAASLVNGGTGGGLRRKKRHRTAFTPTQLLGLENSFEQNQYSVGEERKQLAAFLGLSETQIKVWFQNRRTKWKRIRKEAAEDDDDDDEYQHDHEKEAGVLRGKIKMVVWVIICSMWWIMKRVIQGIQATIEEAHLDVIHREIVEAVNITRF